MRAIAPVRMSTLLAATAVSALIASFPASAQTGPVQSPAAPQEQPAPSPSPEPDQRVAPGVDDIIVTANRRAERNQSVPISITAFSSDRLQQQGIASNQDLQSSVPSLSVSGAGIGSRETQTFSLRGQGATFQSSPGVVVYFNEIPLPQALSSSQQGGPGNYVDLENLQVLAGPQGTLFGRNTTGGAVLLVPKRPTGEFAGYVRTTVGNYDNRQVEGMLNVPLVDDKLMIRAVGSFQDRDGYTRDVVFNKRRDDVHYFAGRLGILARPTETFENYTVAYGVKSDTNGAGNIHVAYNIAALQAFGLCFNDPGCSTYAKASQIAKDLGPRRTAYSVDEYQNTRSWGVENSSRLELGDHLAIRNLIGYQRLKTAFLVDADATPLQQYDTGAGRVANFPVTVGSGVNSIGPLIYQNQGASFSRDDFRVLTEELHLQGSALDNKLTYTVGGFFFDQKPVGDQGYSSVNYCPAAFTGNAFACPPVTLLQGVSIRSKALYAQAAFDFGAVSPALDRLKLTAGYRHTWDRINGFFTRFTDGNGFNGASVGQVICSDTFAALPPGSPPGTFPPKLVTANQKDCTVSGKQKSKAPNWLVGLDYQVNGRLLVFAKVSRGYKAGGFNPFAVRPETNVFAPEKVTTYEAGFKADFDIAEWPARLNASYYRTNYANIQRTAGDFNFATGAQGALVAAAAARINGVEAEFTIKPIRQVELGGTASYGKARYTDFPAVTPATTGPCSKQAYKCLPFPFLPKYTYSVHAAANVPMSNDMGNLSLFVSYSYSGSQNTEPLVLPPGQPGEELESYGLLNASIDWKDIRQSGITAGLFVTNATNNTYRVSNSNVFGSLLTQAVLYGEPRMYGLRVQYQF